jgi:UDP-glucose 4-epimerase
VNVLITGAAGLIGRSLARLYVGRGARVAGVDAAAEAPARIPPDLAAHGRFTLLNEDLLADGDWREAAAGADLAIHLAANSDIQRSFSSPELDLRQGFQTTQRLLEALRAGRCRTLAFASSSAVYGDTRRFPTPEDDGPLLPISLYGAAKLASEALISAYAHGYGFCARLFRPANVVGGEATHGVVYDFVRALRREPRRLRILGDGRQRKPYLHAGECAEAIAWAMERAEPGAQPFNVTPADDLTVDQVANVVCSVLGLAGVERTYAGGERGWPGDVPRVSLDPARLARLGWTAKLSSAQAVERAARELALATHWPLDTCKPAGL